MEASDKIYSIEEIKNIVKPIAAKYDVDRVFLFGSYAKGEAGAKSDIDFIIDRGRLRGLKFAGMLGDLQENFDKNVDLLTLSCLAKQDSYPEFEERIGSEMVLVYGE